MEQASLNFDALPLSCDERAVLDCLSEGRECALSSTEIERRTRLSRRRIQSVIRSLRLKHYRISAATDEPMGYFLNTGQDDTVTMLKKWRKRALKVLMLCAEYNKSCVRMEFDQAVLEQEGENA